MTTEAQKHDDGKLPLDLLPPEALWSLAEVLQYGASKYNPRNWESGLKFSRLYAATLRHITAWQAGENVDPETSLSHLAHALCCISFLMTYISRGQAKDLDDRPESQRFWRKVDMDGKDGCWHWRGEVESRPPHYGLFRMATHPDSPRLAHHVSWELAHGKLPKEKYIRHTCNNYLCVNPAHLKKVGQS